MYVFLITFGLPIDYQIVHFFPSNSWLEMSRPIDKEFEEADDTGVLDISGRNLRQFPIIPGEMLDFSLIFEAGRCG